jgi:RNA-directed DNA polymerase
MGKELQEGTRTVITKEKMTHVQLDFSNITLERILSPDNMLEALKRVEANKGAPGIDGMRTDELRNYILSHPGELSNAVRTGRYCPKPVKRVTIPKAEKGKFRDLGIPTVIDRLVQQAAAQVLSAYYDGTFSDASCGFRPWRGAEDAIFKCLGHADNGLVWTVDMDLAKFFDTVNHSRLIRKLSSHIKDRRVVSLIHKILKSGIDTGTEVTHSDIGLMQGGPLSPVLANIYLDELDKELEARGLSHVRYADDVIILCRSKRAAERILETTTRFLEQRMLLRVNREKSGVSYITRGVKFLGYGFYRHPKKGILPTVHAKSKARLKDSVRQILSRNRKKSVPDIKEELRRKLAGWNAYFKMANYESWMRSTDQWIRRRIRQLLWKLWKRVRTRYKALRRLGCDHEKAYEWANTRKSYWHTANSHILATTLTNDFLKAQGWSWLALSSKPIEWG